MNLSFLERASEYEVRDWLIKSLNLSPYQKEVLRDKEILRFSSFYFYKRRKQTKVSVLWRLTLIVYPVYWILLVVFNPIKWIITGKWGYGRNFIDKFHTPWANKIGI